MAITSDLAMLVSEIDANLSHAETITHGLTNAQFNWSPEPGRWSIAQCFAHLNMVNGPEPVALKAAIDGALRHKLTGEGPFTYGMFSRKFIESQDLPIKKKFKAPKYYVPPPDAELDKTTAEYRGILAEVRKLALSARGLHLSRVKTILPALPAILRPILKMPLGARLALLTAHDRRHLWQAEQVRQHHQFPA